MTPDPYDDQNWSEDWLESELWAHDQPPEQVDIDAMAAYQAVEWPPQTRPRAVVAWVGLAIGLVSVAAIFWALSELARAAYG